MLTLFFFVVSVPFALVASACILYSRARRRKRQALAKGREEELTALLMKKTLESKKASNTRAYQDLAVQLESMKTFQTQVREQLKALQASADLMKDKAERSDEEEKKKSN